MERQIRSEQAIKKGPWTAEEDEVLLNFVNKYGPRDWSSIRSMGLLPRTGKSCRLRWVNKLRPNLKVGCKFSVEEERVVIDLQGRFGNKWATIASYLPGRTDNDVKNFWSTRQKRLARILHSPASSSQITKSQRNNNKGKSLHSVHHQIPTFQAVEFSCPQMNEEPSSSRWQSCSSSYLGSDPQMMQIIPLPDLINIDPISLPLLDDITESSTETKTPNTGTSTDLQTQLQLSFNPAADQSHHDDPVLQGLTAEANFLDLFPNRPPVDDRQLDFGSPALESLEGDQQKATDESEKLAAIPESFFDELPADIFDFLDPFPAASLSALN
ncbi:transcription factor DUO1-like [Diospyros lotus]|uniref:transcription factor DUO1-like n=1 Tax=Diospyros lotus TaxID=55363 RepID=UPI0022562F00|nr:transcription factor DUO1-like [Diospyros lotus]